MSAQIKSNSFTIEVPYKQKLLDSLGLLERVWQEFYKNLVIRIDPLGHEKITQLANNVSVATDILNLSFDKKRVSSVAVNYLIQRVTTSTGATELVETGTFYLSYLPTSESWEISGGPTTAGITLTVTPTGSVQYISTNITGTASLSRIIFRAQTLAGKSSLYSEMGR